MRARGAMSDETTNTTDCTTAELADYDVVLLSHDNLDEFVTALGGVEAIPSNVTIFTEDEHTTETVEFNLIVFKTDGTYGIGTQLHHPFTDDDRVLDLRQNVPGSFAELLLGTL